VNLDSFMAVKSVPGSAEPQQTSEGESPQARPAQPGSGPVGTVVTTPTGVPAPSEISRDTTPNGIVIEYESRPKRMYRVNGVEVPSVTTVLGILNKPQLVWWGMQRGVEGVIDLFDIGALTTYFDWTVDKERLGIAEGEDTLPANEKAVVDLLKQHKLTVNHRLDKASERGVNVHDALESWAGTGRLPNPAEFPETEQGYVRALVKFLEDVDPTPVRCEVLVGSVEHEFAGRFDLDIETKNDREFTSRCYPKQADKREILTPGLRRIDAKTSKGCYATHHLQLEGYEIGATEGGYRESDERRILRLDASGKYEFVKGLATGGQFLAIRRAYQALEELAA
jgi:hypothetical protein